MSYRVMVVTALGGKLTGTITDSNCPSLIDGFLPQDRTVLVKLDSTVITSSGDRQEWAVFPGWQLNIIR